MGNEKSSTYKLDGLEWAGRMVDSCSRRKILKLASCAPKARLFWNKRTVDSHIDPLRADPRFEKPLAEAHMN